MKEERFRIGFFGGTFDPPHHGHAHLILSLQEKHALDEVWVVPAGQHPTKPSIVSSLHRLRMCQLAFSKIPRCYVLDTESYREGPCYTIDTILALIETFPVFRNASRFLLLGADIIPSLANWKEIDRLLTLTSPLVAARGPCDFENQWKLLLQDGWTNTGLFDISSTDIRNRLVNDLYVEHLIPPQVLAYIYDKHLYGVL